MTRKNTEQFTNLELHRLLDDIDNENSLTSSPLSDDEVAEIEAELVYEPISTERDEKLRHSIEEIRAKWLADSDVLDSLFSQAKAVGVTRQDVAKRMRIDLSVLLKLERRILTDIPFRAVRQLSDNLETSYRPVYLYLTQPPKAVQQMAASSKGQPEESQPESWSDAISNSQMSEEDKSYWLNAEN